MTDIEKTYMIKNLKNFIEQEKIWLQNTLNSVGWDVSDLNKFVESSNSELVSCSVDPEHRLPPESILKHEKECEKRNGKYHEVVDSLSYELEDEKRHALLIDDIIDPNATDGELSQSAKKKKEQKELSAKCLMELLVAERDAKRRRAAHRGKRVHSNKKSYNEIVREVISSQMETLTESIPVDIESGKGKAESTPKNVVHPCADCYLGVGSKCYSENPHKRWLSIEEEEKKLIEEINKKNKETLKEKGSRRRDDSCERHRNYEKSARDYKHNKKDYRYERQDKHKDYERHKYEYAFDDNCNYNSHKTRDRNYHTSHYSEKCVEKNTLKDDSKGKRHYDSDSNVSHSKHSKKHKKRSRERSSHKKSRHKSRNRNSSDK